MGNNDFSNIGEQIRGAVQDAIDSMNFNELNRIISGTISQALDEASRHLGGNRDRNREDDYIDVEYRECTGAENAAGGYRPADGGTERNQAAGAGNRTERNQAAKNWAGGERTVREWAEKIWTGENWAGQTPPGYDNRGPAGAAPQTGPRPAGVRASDMQGPGVQSSGMQHPAEVIVHPPSRVSGILFTVFGSIGLGISLSAFLAALIVAMVTPAWIPAGGIAVLMGVLAFISAVLMGIGNSIRGRAKRLKLYLKEAGGKSYCSIRALVGCTGKQEKFVIRDLKKMIRDGILPHAHIDAQNTCLMLNDSAYKQYQQSLEALKLRTQEESPKTEIPAETDHKSQVIRQGREYLKALREANQAIPGEVISAKLYRLEEVIEKIFHVVDMHPEQLDDIERFMDYYLPTTVKLVVAYQNFDSVGITGENIMMAKQEVEQTLDTINQAFERLLDDLYRDEAFDVSTDASVLQAMLKKDGFVNSDFERKSDSKNGGSYEPK